MTRFEIMNKLLDQSLFFKLVCGAGNEDIEEVKKLSMLYTLAGAKGMDVSANPKVVNACVQGIDLAISMEAQFNIKISVRPFITVSIGMPGDHHVRKAEIMLENCIKCNLCIPVCPTDAIPTNLIVIESKCIGCGNCSAVCPVNVIDYYHNEKNLLQILPECLKAGAEQIELHAAIKEDEYIMKEWEIVNSINPNAHVSMCLDRLHLSDFALESRIKKAKEISGDRLIIQADGYPMSGGEDDFNTTLQAISTTDVINKRFNKKLNRKTGKSNYKKINHINILMSGGTNSLSTNLAKQNDVRFQGVSIGTFARKIIKEYIEIEDFYNNIDNIKKAYLIARQLVIDNVGDVNLVTKDFLN
ncbi:MAG: 4Fe-4S binding protein [Candidatus Sericytochromatia bacterium]|nr:4Fe-4S binding protein [Candidatus Sericytochromatia bacterium]